MPEPRQWELRPILLGLTAELLFVLFPALVVFFVLVMNGHGWSIWSKPEWAFGACILFGQALIRLTSAVHKGGADPRSIAFYAALLIVPGLIPSAICLYIILDLGESQAPIPTALWITQMVLFIVSVLCYVLFGIIAEVWPGGSRSGKAQTVGRGPV